MIAPAYTMTVPAARNWALASRNRPDVESTTDANQRALWIGSRLVIVRRPPASAAMLNA